MDRMLRKLAPLAAAVVVLASAGAHAQLGGSSSLNPGMPSVSPPAAGGGFNAGAMPPSSTETPTQGPGISNPRVSNYGAGGMQREPGSLPRFH